MKPELKVTSQPLSARMKELGWDYETERYWHKPLNCKIAFLRFCREDRGRSRVDKYYPAPDATEIGERLPHRVIGKDKLTYTLKISKWNQVDLDCIEPDKKVWDVLYHQSQDDFPTGYSLEHLSGNTEAEARGKMWCYLKENKLI